MPLPQGTPATLVRAVVLAGLATLMPGVVVAADLVIRVNGVSEPLGQVGCALYAGAAGFPMDNATARVQWQAADAKGVTCRFADVAEGDYAVSIAHDRNGNKRVDTNFMGMPTEQWGVSNNARPRMRAPRFEEARFKVSAGAGDVVLDITVAK
jgi:uncharacterized protein (DUF2141 family)